MSVQEHLAVRNLVESWLDSHERPNLAGPAEGPRTIMVSLDATGDLERGIERLLEPAVREAT